ncbi:hypothetical protein HC024_10140, partial [Methylococcaceae bacterium WWC4]|nr:hypothetical protein [Methylococcaceae bacterium WWC4]
MNTSMSAQPTPYFGSAQPTPYFDSAQPTSYIDCTDMALGSDIYNFSLDAYASLKIAG